MSSSGEEGDCEGDAAAGIGAGVSTGGRGCEGPGCALKGTEKLNC